MREIGNIEIAMDSVLVHEPSKIGLHACKIIVEGIEDIYIYAKWNNDAGKIAKKGLSLGEPCYFVVTQHQHVLTIFQHCV